MSVPLMVAPAQAPATVPVRSAAGSGRDEGGSDAFSGVLDEAHESQRSDRAVERSRSAEHSQAPEPAHGATAAKPRSDDDQPAPAPAATDPSLVAGGLLVGGLTPTPTPVPATAATAADVHAGPVSGPRDARKIGVTPAGHDAVAPGAVGARPATPATPAVPAHKATDAPLDATASSGVAADQAIDLLHGATPAGSPPNAATPSPPVTPNAPALPAAGPTPPTGVAAGPAAPAVAATPAVPTHRADAPPVASDPAAAATVASSGFATALRDATDPAAPRPGKRAAVDEAPAVAAASAPSAPRIDTASPVADVESIRPAQAALPEQPLLLGALSKLRDRGNGVHELTVSLHPAELGAVNLTAVVRDGSITVSLDVVDPAARAAVTSALPGLHHDLAQSGFSGVDVSVADHGKGRHAPSGESRPSGSGGHGPAPRDDRPDERPAPRRSPLLDRYLDRLL